MAYVRKTEDEFQIHMYSEPTGWEEVTCETTRKEAIQRLREYRTSAPEYQYKMVKRRIPIGGHDVCPTAR